MSTRSFSLLIGLVMVSAAFAKDDYQLGPDSRQQEGVPQGKLEGPFEWHSKIFEGTTRKYWIYVPAQYDGKKPACVMVFQDGHAYALPKETYQVPTVFDNLIQKKQMPVTVGIFINPGNKAGEPPADAKNWGRAQRSLEYDSLGDRYARFLLEEILPEVGKKYKLTSDPEGRAICGASSGGICAFTVAWERPDQFRKVISHIGSFTNIRGGHVYPRLIRESPKKPIRIFLQDGSGDLRNAKNLARDWYLQNQAMAAALKEKGYDFKAVFGDGGHTGKHGASILPDQLRWLWRDYVAGAAANAADAPRKDMALLEGEWSMVSGEADGMPLPDQFLKGSRRVVKDGVTTVHIGGDLFLKARFTIDPMRNPKTIDYEMLEGFTKGQKQLGIYEIDGERVRFCFASPGQERPTEFKGGNGLVLSVWQRTKKAP
jgi:enterochelin esterase family protein